MLGCEDGSIYTGITNDIERRLGEHLRQGAKAARYTRSHRVVELLALWETQGRPAASALENRIKRLDREGKLGLVADPGSVDVLFDSVDREFSPVGEEEMRAHWRNALDAVGDVSVAGRGGGAGIEQVGDADAVGELDESWAVIAGPGSEDAEGGGSRTHPLNTYIDMHCHLGFASNFEDLVRELEANGAKAFCNTVTPSEYGDLCQRLARLEPTSGPLGDGPHSDVADGDVEHAADGESAEGEVSAGSRGVVGGAADAASAASGYAAAGGAVIALGLGLHPWWVDDDVDAALDRFDELIAQTRFIGEVGLDFGKRGAGTAALQIRAFEHIAGLIASREGITVSIHAIKSAGKVMDILEDAGALEGNRCILHWFSGSSDELKRARQMGFYFSVNPMMARSRRGAEYIKAIEADRLLLETDAPPEGERYSFAEQQEQLSEAAAVIAEAKGQDVLHLVASNSLVLLS